MKLTTADPLTLTHIDEHPAVIDAQTRLTQAQRLLADADKAVTTADADLVAAERAAANGQRDDKRLRTAQDNVVRVQSDLRIARARVETAQQTVTRTFEETCLELEAHLKEQQQHAARALADALLVARDRSHELARLESASSRLFAGGPYRQYDKLPGRPLERLAWYGEFGGPHGQSETRLSYWLQHIQRYLQKGA